MDFSKFSQNEKLMIYGAVAAVIGGLVGGISGLIWLAVLAGLAMLVVLFLPQFSPNTKLPGSRGSLLVAIGAIGAVAAALAFLIILVDIGFWFEFSAVRTIVFLIGVAGALLMGWIAWQEFRAEGGKFELGAATSSGSTAATSATTDTPAADPTPPAADATASADAPRADADGDEIARP
ncbi:MAG: hypothetical protein ACRDGD_06510 [Candidatus Limnocylindria bacterium]